MLGLVAVEAFPGGASPTACDNNLTPQHGSNPQTDALPFSVDISAFTGNTYTPGNMYTSKKRNTVTTFDQ